MQYDSAHAKETTFYYFETKFQNIEKNHYEGDVFTNLGFFAGTWNHSNSLLTRLHLYFKCQVKYVALHNKMRPWNGKYFSINVRMFLTLLDLGLLGFLILNHTSWLCAVLIPKDLYGTFQKKMYFWWRWISEGVILRWVSKDVIGFCGGLWSL